MKTLCESIAMPREVTEAVLAIHADPGFHPATEKLRHMETWEAGLRELRAAVAPDPEGFRELAAMLRCALDAREDYERIGLGRDIYCATFACFSRFVREHRESYGRYGFDRGFWTVRQLSCRLFRIGELEYELLEQNGEKAVSLHIPTDVRLELPRLRASWLQAKELLGQAFPEYRDAPYYCHSWLLSPTLAELLPPSSRILAFQRSFRVEPLEAPSDEFLQWVFKNPGLKPEDYPEDTGLQRRLKARILSGGGFTDARGCLRAEPFLE